MELSEPPFASIQGEGIRTGIGSIFIRLARCNLKCSWCDTAYAQQPGFDQSVSNIIQQVQQLPDLPDAVITGGEPLLQQLHILLCDLQELHKFVTVETNGTIWPCAATLSHTNLWSVSPKMSNSGMEKHLNMNVLKNFASLTNCQMKFVVSTPADVDEVVELVNKLQPRQCPVILQPQSYAADSLNTLKDIITYVLQTYPKYPFRMLPQLHLLLYGRRRGI